MLVGPRGRADATVRPNVKTTPTMKPSMARSDRADLPSRSLITEGSTVLPQPDEAASVIRAQSSATRDAADTRLLRQSCASPSRNWALSKRAAPRVWPELERRPRSPA